MGMSPQFVMSLAQVTLQSQGLALGPPVQTTGPCCVGVCRCEVCTEYLLCRAQWPL